MSMDKIEGRRYQKIPTQEELASLDRDLRFLDLNTEQSLRLTGEQIRTYSREGYIEPLQIFDTAPRRCGQARDGIWKGSW